MKQYQLEFMKQNKMIYNIVVIQYFNVQFVQFL